MECFSGVCYESEPFGLVSDIFRPFLVVSHHSIGGCVRPSVRPSVRLSVHWSVRNALTRRAETGRRAAYVGYTNLLLVFCELNKCITEQWIGGPMDGSLNRPMDGSRDGPTDEMMDTLLVGQMDGPMNGPVVG